MASAISVLCKVLSSVWAACWITCSNGFTRTDAERLSVAVSTNRGRLQFSGLRKSRASAAIVLHYCPSKECLFASSPIPYHLDTNFSFGKALAGRSLNQTDITFEKRELLKMIPGSCLSA